MSERELKPCPYHLRSEPEAENAEFEFYGRKQDKVRHFVICLACGSRGPTSETRAGAIESWNRRATPPGFDLVPEGIWKQIREAVEGVQELPDTMPDEMYRALQGDKEFCEQACREFVKQTKSEIMGQIVRVIAAHRFTQKETPNAQS